MARIFISHASADKDLAKAFVDLLEAGVGVPHNEIFCTSLKGQGIPPGSKFVETIKKHLEDCELVFILVTPTYYQRTFCQIELGATWMGSKRFIPVLAPGSDYSELKAVLEGIQSPKLDREADLDDIHDQVKELVANPPSTSRWNERRDEFLAKVKGLVVPVPPAVVSPSTPATVPVAAGPSTVEIEWLAPGPLIHVNDHERAAAVGGSSLVVFNGSSEDLLVTTLASTYGANGKRIKEAGEQTINKTILAKSYLKIDLVNAELLPPAPAEIRSLAGTSVMVTLQVKLNLKGKGAPFSTSAGLEARAEIVRGTLPLAPRPLTEMVVNPLRAVGFTDPPRPSNAPSAGPNASRGIALPPNPRPSAGAKQSSPVTPVRKEGDEFLRLVHGVVRTLKALDSPLAVRVLFSLQSEPEHILQHEDNAYYRAAKEAGYVTEPSRQGGIKARSESPKMRKAAEALQELSTFMRNASPEFASDYEGAHDEEFTLNQRPFWDRNFKAEHNRRLLLP
jgi:hypothetical protein